MAAPVLTAAELLWQRRLAESRENGTYWLEADPADELDARKHDLILSADSGLVKAPLVRRPK